MTDPHVQRPGQHVHVQFVGPGVNAATDSRRRKSSERILAAVAAVGVILVAAVVPLALSSTSALSGSPVAANTAPTISSRPSRPSSPRPAPTTTSKRSILEPDPDANPAACNIVSWEDLPPDVRSKTFTPAPRSTENPNVFMCWLDNSDLSIVVRGPSDPPGSPGDNKPSSLYFKVKVYLGRDINADVNDHKDNPKLDEVREVTVGDEYPGVLVRDRANDGKKDVPRCFVAFRAPGNKALAEITNDRFPQYNVCDLAMQLAEKIAPRVR
jgi:hypothetical protein